MPRHSPNALTSHLRVHTTNDNPDIPAVGMTFSVANDADDCFLSQPNITCVDCHDRRSAANRFPIVNRTSAASIEKPIHNVKVPMNEAEASMQTRSKAGTVVFIPGITLLATFRPRSVRNGGAYRDRTDDPLLAKQVLSQLS